jgi:hypothetical protein
MKYLCLVYAEEMLLEKIDDADCLACSESIQQAGQQIAAEALHPVRTATTVRIRNGSVSMTDGPFAETKEQLTGFYLIEATDLNDALRIAMKIPVARVGSIEVRPVRQLNV